MAESNPNSFNCSAKKDIANKPFKIGDPTNYFEDPVVCSGFIDVQGIPSRPTDIEITNGDVRIYTGNLLVRPGISTFQEVQVQKELYVCNDTDLKSRLYVGGETYQQGDVYIQGTTGTPLVVAGDANFGAGIGQLTSRFATADSLPKPFDMVHPTKGEGHRLRYACIEGPEVAVYCRGRTKTNEITLPDYWKDLVHEDSISVQLQPIGSSQDIIVMDFNNEKITLSGNVDCFYHVYGERKDINPLIVEYEGTTWHDYPDPNYDPNKVPIDQRITNDSRFAGSPNTNTI